MTHYNKSSSSLVHIPCLSRSWHSVRQGNDKISIFKVRYCTYLSPIILLSLLQFLFEECSFKVQKGKEGTGRIVMWNMGIANSFTMEVIMNSECIVQLMSCTYVSRFSELLSLTPSINFAKYDTMLMAVYQHPIQSLESVVLFITSKIGHTEGLLIWHLYLFALSGYILRLRCGEI